MSDVPTWPNPAWQAWRRAFRTRKVRVVAHEGARLEEIAELAVLAEAWSRVRANKGGPGGDGVTLAPRRRFVDRFVQPKVSSRVSWQRLSSRDAALPSRGSSCRSRALSARRRAQFPTLISTMKALRRPAHAVPVTCLFRFRAPRDASAVRARLIGAPGRVEAPDPGPGQCSTGCPLAGVLSRGRERDLTGSQAIHLMPLPRSKTPAGSTIPHHGGVVDAAPAQTTAKAPAIVISRLLTRLRHLLPTLQERRDLQVQGLPAGR